MRVTARRSQAVPTEQGCCAGSSTPTLGPVIAQPLEHHPETTAVGSIPAQAHARVGQWMENITSQCFSLSPTSSINIIRI